MAEPTVTTAAGTSTSSAGSSTQSAKGHFAKAMEEAKAGVQQLTKEAQDRAGTYREKAGEYRDKAGVYREKVGQTGNEWASQARDRTGQTRERATELANDGKARASSALAGLGKMVEENCAMVDERIGPRYGDYARTTARSLQDAAERLDSKELAELGEDALEFVRKNPAVAVGAAAVTGFLIARMFKGSDAN